MSLLFLGPKGHQKHLAGLLADTLNKIAQDMGWKSGLDAVSMKFWCPYSLGRKNTVRRKPSFPRLMCQTFSCTEKHLHLLFPINERCSADAVQGWTLSCGDGLKLVHSITSAWFTTCFSLPAYGCVPSPCHPVSRAWSRRLTVLALDPGFCVFLWISASCSWKKDASVSPLVKWKFCFSKSRSTCQMFLDKQMKRSSEEGSQGMWISYRQSFKWN